MPENDLWGKFSNGTRGKGNSSTSAQRSEIQINLLSANIKNLESERAEKLEVIKRARLMDERRIENKVKTGEIKEGDKQDSLRRAKILRDNQVVAINQKYDKLIADARASIGQTKKERDALQVVPLTIEYVVHYDSEVSKWYLLVKRDPVLDARSKFTVRWIEDGIIHEKVLPYTDKKYIYNNKEYVVLRSFDKKVKVLEFNGYEY